MKLLPMKKAMQQTNLETFGMVIKLNKRKRGNFRMKKKKHFVRLAKINCDVNTVYMHFSFMNINE